MWCASSITANRWSINPQMTVFQDLHTLLAHWGGSEASQNFGLVMPSPKEVLLLTIGPGKVVRFLNNHTQIITSLKKTVFQDLHTLKVENFKFWVKIWNWLGKSFPKMVLLLKIGSGKVVLFLNNRTQKIPIIPFYLVKKCPFLSSLN